MKKLLSSILLLWGLLAPWSLHPATVPIKVDSDTILISGLSDFFRSNVLSSVHTTVTTDGNGRIQITIHGGAVTNLVEEATPGAGDFIPMVRASDLALVKVDVDNLPAGGGSGDVTKVGTPVDNQIGLWTGNGTIEGTNSFAWSPDAASLITSNAQFSGSVAVAGITNTAGFRQTGTIQGVGTPDVLDFGQITTDNISVNFGLASSEYLNVLARTGSTEPWFEIFDTNLVSALKLGTNGNLTLAGDLSATAGTVAAGIITSSGNINANGNIVGDGGTSVTGVFSLTTGALIVTGNGSIGTFGGNIVSTNAANTNIFNSLADIGTPVSGDKMWIMDESEAVMKSVDASEFLSAGSGDSVSIDGVGVTDPDFVSTGDVDVVDTSNTITMHLNEDVVDPAHMADGDHGFFSYSANVATLDSGGLTSANLLAGLNDETGTGVAVFGTAPTFTTSIDIGSAGVRLSDDGDGALTILGLGNGFNESLTVNLDDTENEATVTSSTGVDTLNLGSIKLLLDQIDVGTLNADIFNMENTVTNLAHASSQTFYGDRLTYAFQTNDLAGDVSVLLTNGTAGHSFKYSFGSDGSARTISFFSDLPMHWVSTNATSDGTNFVSVASKRGTVYGEFIDISATQLGIELWGVNEP